MNRTYHLPARHYISGHFAQDICPHRPDWCLKIILQAHPKEIP